MDRRLDPTVETEVAERMRFALDLAAKVAELVLGYFRAEGLVVETKGDASPVTIADRAAERLLREEIGARYPEDGILGEEHGIQPGAPFRWILDPIDGTESFVRGVPLFGTLIGLEWDGAPVGGVLGLPALDEVLYAWRGRGAWQQQGSGRPRPARVSTVATMREALLTTTSASGFYEIGRGRLWSEMVARFGKTRGWSDCYAYALVATGRAEAAIDPQMHIWDCAALLPILEEAGGRFTDWSGVPTIASPNAVASNGLFHTEIVALLREG